MLMFSFDHYHFEIIIIAVFEVIVNCFIKMLYLYLCANHRFL